MDVTVEDLELVLWYLKKEQVKRVTVTQVSTTFELVMDFKDSEGRQCEISIHDPEIRAKPVRLKKEMDLETRLNKEKPNE